MYLCGIYEAPITPPLGSSMPGQSAERKSSGVLEELYVKALVLEMAGTTVAWIVVDALYVPWHFTHAIRERVRNFTGIPEDQVIVSATHTHTGPPIRPGFDGSTSDNYVAYLTDRAADAAIIAYNKRQPARVGWGTGEVHGLSFNRRYWMKDGSLTTNPGIGNPHVDRPAGPIDPELQVVRVDDASGNPLCVVVNFACHTCTVSGTEYHPDFPGVLSRELKRALGEAVVSLFLLGACGDINHLNVFGQREAVSSSCEWIGLSLAQNVLAIREATPTEIPPTLEMRHHRFQMELRIPTDAELEAVRETAVSSAASLKDRSRALQLLDGLWETSRLIEIQALRIGGWAMIGLPAELFTELGLTIKKRSPFASTMVVTLCNGSLYGYVCTAEAFRQGGYGTALSPSRIPQNAGERLVNEALTLLDSLYAEE